ncbi:uncharacterized protein LOC107263568 [Cephus cinctus]|uniref:Uncharacterized protein LOC107263568 n=1 Tax=Cephus cinctus TaxID=211228 RepID=A0AAJ7BHX7_CEPCN|nr:uncharacterized protein LOC107263568 [Cephus cinctus]
MSKITTLGFVLIVLVARTTGDTRSSENVKLSQEDRRGLPMRNHNYVLSESSMSNARVQSDAAIEKRRNKSAQEVKAGLDAVIRIMKEVASASLPKKCRQDHEAFRLNARNYMRDMRHCIVKKFQDLTAFRKKKREVIDAAIRFIREINDNMTELDKQTMNKLRRTVRILLSQTASISPKSTSCASKEIIENIVSTGKEFIKNGC